ncbi:hypothetical protein AB4Y85_02600 [Microvirga sp. 2YAF29]|uniref:hypothetical protein n=1 Tax=Microvirga sp. 2YAF29 TaxID=3233031 RepID=UPI003F988CB1
MSPRSPDDTHEDDMQDKILHAVHNALDETHESQKEPASVDEEAPAEKAKQVEFIETTVELDRVAVYLKGPTAFSA